MRRRRRKKSSVLLSYIATMTGQFFPGSCGDLNPACRGSLDFVMRERVSTLRDLTPACRGR
jgi:hypothetical protein